MQTPYVENGSVRAESSSAYDGIVRADVDVSAVARLLADPARTRILSNLHDGRELPAGELARRAGISASTASEHLARLVDGGLLSVTRAGRHRYYRLTNDEVARAFEALASIAPLAPARSLRQAMVGEALAAARTCYDHLAGALGVAVTDALLKRRALVGGHETLELGPRAGPVLASLGIELDELPARRPRVLRCLDWSERRPHVAGGLGAAICSKALSEAWIDRLPRSRAVRVTPAGRKVFAALGIPHYKYPG
jgi:DNA-binding transcriptional ArsR family regulator